MAKKKACKACGPKPAKASKKTCSPGGVHCNLEGQQAKAAGIEPEVRKLNLAEGMAAIDKAVDAASGSTDSPVPEVPQEAAEKEPEKEEEGSGKARRYAKSVRNLMVSIPSQGAGPQDYRPSKTVKYGTLELYHHKGMIVVIDNGPDAEKNGGHVKMIRYKDLLQRIASQALALQRVPLWSDEDRKLRSFCLDATALAIQAKAYGDPCDDRVQDHYRLHKPKNSVLLGPNGLPYKHGNN